MIDYVDKILLYSDNDLLILIENLYKQNVTDNEKETLNKLIIALQHAKQRNLKSNYIDFLNETNLLREDCDCGVSFGADPEFMLVDKNGGFVLFNSKLVTNWFSLSSARIGGDLGLLEFRVPPSKSIEAFSKNIDDLTKKFEDSFSDESGSNLRIDEHSAIEIPLTKLILESKDGDDTLLYGSSKNNSYMNNSGTVMLEGRTFYAYRDKPNDNDYTFTSCGGHLHFGGIVKSFTQKQIEHLVKLFDTYLSPLYLKAESKDQSVLRRKYYGLAGEYRIKEYGFEYRTPDNSLFYKKNREVLESVLKKSLWIIQNIVNLTPNEGAQHSINNCYC